MPKPDYSFLTPVVAPAGIPEVRLSPDNLSVAIRTENAFEAFNAWAYIHRRNGGGFISSADVADWTVIQEAVDPHADS